MKTLGKFDQFIFRTHRYFTLMKTPRENTANNRLGKTPLEAFMGKRPDVSNMHIFALNESHRMLLFCWYESCSCWDRISFDNFIIEMYRSVAAGYHMALSKWSRKPYGRAIYYTLFYKNKAQIWPKPCKNNTGCDCCLRFAILRRWSSMFSIW